MERAQRLMEQPKQQRFSIPELRKTGNEPALQFRFATGTSVEVPCLFFLNSETGCEDEELCAQVWLVGARKRIQDMCEAMLRWASCTILHNVWCISKKTFAIASFVWLDSTRLRATIVSVP